MRHLEEIGFRWSHESEKLTLGLSEMTRVWVLSCSAMWWWTEKVSLCRLWREPSSTPSHAGTRTSKYPELWEMNACLNQMIFCWCPQKILPNHKCGSLSIIHNNYSRLQISSIEVLATIWPWCVSQIDCLRCLYLSVVPAHWAVRRSPSLSQVLTTCLSVVQVFRDEDN